MNLKHIKIRNFRSCREVSLDFSNLHAIVGSNNAGKSALLRAIDFFINPSSRKINEEAFWAKQTNDPIWIEGVFGDLNEWEQECLRPNLLSDGSFVMAREVRWANEASEASNSDGDADAKAKVSTFAYRTLPKCEWLREDKINGENIGLWWKQKEGLQANGVSFGDLLGSTKPAVGVWKTKAKEFLKHLSPEDFETQWVPNPTGYANVLKGTLPILIFIPAVRDVQDESKSTESSPFGKLLRAIVNAVSPDQRKAVETSLEIVSRSLNRGDNAGRIQAVAATEKQLNDNLKRIFGDCDLELSFQTPTLESLIGTPKLFIDDGFRCSIENKGHGLQRATIFAILQSYATLSATTDAAKKRSLMFAVEEPELYMHPQAQRTIRRLFQDVAKGGDQVFFSTHSSFMVDVTFFDEIIRVESAPAEAKGIKSVQSKVFQLPMEKMISDLETRVPALKGRTSPQSFRDHYSHAYNPTRNEGFFAKKIVLVEGDTEEYALPIYAEALGRPFDRESICVVDCGGKNSMDRLYRVFNELGIPCYLLFDYDRTSTDPESLRASKDLLKLFHLPEQAPAQALVTESICCLPDNWEKDVEGNIQNIGTLRSEARQLLGLKNDSGKPLISRFVARRICSQDQKQIPQIIPDLISNVRDAKWTGSCLAGTKPQATTADKNDAQRGIEPAEAQPVIGK